MRKLTNKRNKTVLVYIKDNDQVLMIHKNKKHDLNYDKYLGVGGHIEKGETEISAAIREVKEETNLDIFDFKCKGKIHFIDTGYNEIMYLFLVNNFKGELISNCDEGELSWVNIKDINNLNIWEGDRYFLTPLFNNEDNIKMKLVYKDGKLIKVKKRK